ncbi:hypothetical protein ACS0TY_026317 [Phlomoides rotata]
MFKVVGNGKSTKFWRDIWVGTEPLSRSYNRLFRVSNQQEVCIDGMGRWTETGWEWDMKWRRGLRESDQVLLTDLMLHLSTVILNRSEEDIWRWRHSSDGIFSTASAYQKCWITDATDSEEQNQKITYHRLWNSFAPRRYQDIVWKILHNQLPTKDRLQRMGIISESEDIKCALCDEENETATHLMTNFRTGHIIWARVYEWLGTAMVPRSDSRINLLQHREILGRGKMKRIASTIWICTAWTIWNCRNKVIFSEESPNINKMIGHIKARTWNWVIAKSKGMQGTNFTDWSNDIRRCCENRR